MDDIYPMHLLLGVAILLAAVLLLSWPSWVALIADCRAWLSGDLAKRPKQLRNQGGSWRGRLGIAGLVLTACLGHSASLASLADYFGLEPPVSFKARSGNADPTEERAEDSNSVRFNDLVAEAIDKMDLGEFKEAKPLLDQSLEIGSVTLIQAAEALMKRAEISREVGRLGEAVALARLAADLDGSVGYRNALADMLTEYCGFFEVLDRLDDAHDEVAKELKRQAGGTFVSCIKEGRAG